MDEIEAALGAVAPRLRDLRTERDLTLADVSEATGIGVSTLSRLESGSRRPSLDLLLPLARTYGVPLDDLVGAPPSGDPRIHPKPVNRGGRIYIPLSHNPIGVQAVKCIVPGTGRGSGKVEGRRAGAKGHGHDHAAQPAGMRRHAGYEWFYVLSGTVRLQLGDEVTLVETGQAAEFDCRLPHAITSADDGEVEMLSLFSTEGERIHVQGR